MSNDLNPTTHRIEITISDYLFKNIEKFQSVVGPKSSRSKIVIHLIEMGLRSHNLKVK